MLPSALARLSCIIIDCHSCAFPVQLIICCHSFAVAALTTWNSLPLHIDNSSYMFGFSLSTQNFMLAFDPS